MSGGLSSPALWISRVLSFLGWILGLVSVVWQGLLLVETCTVLDNHLNPRGAAGRG